MLCPPPLIDSGRPCSRAALTHGDDVGRRRGSAAMSAGRRSIIAFQTERASSYPGIARREEGAADAAPSDR